MSKQGNSLVAELDATQRELRTLKEHYYVMERYLRDEIRQEYIDDLNKKNSMLKKHKTDFKEFKN